MPHTFSNITIGNSEGFDPESFDTSVHPSELRCSEQRRRTLERYANAHAPIGKTVDLFLSNQISSAFALNPDVGQSPEDTPNKINPRDFLGTDADYVIFVTSQKTPIPLDETPYQSRQVLDYAAQCAFILHEVAHVCYTNFRDYARVLGDIIGSYNEQQVTQVAQSFFNGFEDGAIERAIRLDTTERAAERQKLLNHFLRVQYQERTFSWLSAVSLSAIDLSVYDTGTLRKLLDPENTDFVFANSTNRQVFISLLPDLLSLRNGVLYTPDPETRYNLLADFWNNKVDPLIAKSQSGSQQQKQHGSDTDSSQTGQTQQQQSTAEPEPENKSSSHEDGSETQGSNTSPDDDNSQESQGNKPDQGAKCANETSPKGQNVSDSEETSEESSEESSEKTSEETPEESSQESGGPAESSATDSEAAGEEQPDSVPSPTAGDNVEPSEHFPDDYSRAASVDDNAPEPLGDDTGQPADDAPAPTEDDLSQSSQSGDEPARSNDTDSFGDQSKEAPQLSNQGGAKATQENGTDTEQDSIEESTEQADTSDSNKEEHDPSGDHSNTESGKDTPNEDSTSGESQTPESTSEAETSEDADKDGETDSPEVEAYQDGQTTFDAFSSPSSDSPSNSQTSTDSADSDGNDSSPESTSTSSETSPEQPQRSESDGEQTSRGDGKDQHDEHSDERSTSESAAAKPQANAPSPEVPGGSDKFDADEDYLNAEHEAVESQSPDEELPAELDRELDQLEQTLEELNREYDSTVESKKDGGNGSGSGVQQDTLQVMPTSGVDATKTERWTEAVDESPYTGQTLKQALTNSQRDDVTRGRSSGRYDSGRSTAYAVGKTTYFRQRDFGGDRQYALIIVLDRSGSMTSGKNLINPAEKAVAQFALAAEEIGIDVSILDFYNGEIRVPAPFGTPIEHCADSIVTGDATGGTPLSDALALGRERVKQEASRNLHPLMLVVTDGKPANDDAYLEELERTNQEIPSVMGLTLSPGTDPHNPPEKFAEQEQYFNSHEFVTSLSSKEITEKLEDVALQADSLKQ